MMEATNPPIPSMGMRLWDRVIVAIQVGVVGFFRQSDPAQARRHVGSQKVQEAQISNVRPFGVPPDKVDVLLAYGESGREDVVRRKFRELLHRVRAGKVGLILLARHDRLGRNTRDSEELFEAMRQNGVLIMVDGRIYDPSDPSDDFILTIYAKFAEFENRARARWMMLARFAKARDRMLAVPMPSVMVWADPEDAEFVAALEAQGMGHWLDRLGRDRTNVRVDGRRLHVLPFPDARVERCMRLMVSWLVETGSTTMVARRIEEGASGWPCPGEIPTRVSAKRWAPGDRIGWTSVSPSKVYDQLRSPALFGTYQYRAPTLDPEHRRRRPGGAVAPRAAGPKAPPFQVRYPDSFAGFFEPEMEQRVREKLGPGPRARPGMFQVTLERITGAALRIARCGYPRGDGRRCGRILRPVHMPNGDWAYRSHHCDRWARPRHRTVIPRALDDHVLDVLREVFTPSRLRSVVERVTVEAKEVEDREGALMRRLAEAQATEDGAASLVIHAAAKLERARRAGDMREQRVQQRLKARWERSAADAGEMVSQLEGELAGVRDHWREFAAASDADLERVTALAADLPVLIERARGVPFATQQIVEALVERVWVREIGHGVVEFSVEFPTGAEVRRLFTTTAPHGTHPQRLLARQRLAAGAPIQAVAAELAVVQERQPRGWKASHVIAAAAYSEHFESES
ncbi:MAG: recombinase family protein, partial [Gemmatimonadetes bacterium]|nr:recombinase family protein [Gemmatimonadota bacterium]